MMYSSSPAGSALPLHGRNGLPPPVGASGLGSVDKEPLSIDSRHSANTPPPPPFATDGVTDVLAVSNAPNSSGVLQSSPTPMMRSRDRICFRHLVMAAVTAAATLLICVWCAWRATADSSVNAVTGRVVPYTFHYFMYCLLGGVVAGTVHVVVTPIDVVKCRVQVGEYRSFREGFAQIFYAEADRSIMRALPLFLRGWVPTAWGYCIQGALKFCLYEVLKYVLLIGPLERLRAEEAAAGATSQDPSLVPSSPVSSGGNATGGGSVYHSGVFQLIMFLLASSAAEVVADVGLAPWEAVKIRMQTSSTFPTSLRSALPRMWEAEGLHGFYKGLVPLWCRQVPYTMMKFASFEVIVVMLASALHALGLLDPKYPSTLGKLFVSLLAGMLAGVLCGLISHPADTVLSKLNQKGTYSGSGGGIGNGVPQAPLLASAIAAARHNSMGGGGGGSNGTLHDILVLLRDLGWRGVWKGLAPRLLMVSTLTALQWVTYDSFKVLVGLPTSGGVGH